MQRWKTGKISIFNSLDIIFDFLTSWVENLNQVLIQDWYQIESECWNWVFKSSQKIDIKTRLDDQFTHLYLREILKQDMNSFVDYYNLFYQKKECSLMKDFSLINCLKHNVNYFTQIVIFFCWNLNKIWSFIFHQWIQAFFDIDEEFQQLKHHQSCFIFIIISFIKVKSISALINNFLSSKIITFVTVVLTVSSSLSLLFLDESMNLSFIIIIIQDKILIISEIKKICNK